MEILGKELCHDGFFQLERYRLRHELFAGGMSRELRRELFVRGEAAAVLLYDPEPDSVVLIEQFRIGAMQAANGGWSLETVAGVVEEGESLEDLVRREALEEAGCVIGEMLPICTFYTSPGATNERIALFVGRTVAPAPGGIHGLDHEGEDIKVHVLGFDAALRKIATGEIDSSYTIMALQWLALNKAEVAGKWK